MSRWISCSERLPNKKEANKILVVDEDGIMAVCRFLPKSQQFIVKWDNTEFIGVIAWQIPDPYSPTIN